MDTVANMPADDRADLFRNTGAQMGLESALIEKDFWVCWILAHLFDIEDVRDALMFKGGTALSKVFKLIDRFSEDIDLAIDYAPLGFVNDVILGRTCSGRGVGGSSMRCWRAATNMSRARSFKRCAIGASK